MQLSPDQGMRRVSENGWQRRSVETQRKPRHQQPAASNAQPEPLTFESVEEEESYLETRQSSPNAAHFPLWSGSQSFAASGKTVRRSGNH